jgi:hypothetical protein
MDRHLDHPAIPELELRLERRIVALHLERDAVAHGVQPSRERLVAVLCHGLHVQALEDRRQRGLAESGAAHRDARPDLRQRDGMLLEVGGEEHDERALALVVDVQPGELVGVLGPVCLEGNHRILAELGTVRTDADGDRWKGFAHGSRRRTRPGRRAADHHHPEEQYERETAREPNHHDCHHTPTTCERFRGSTTFDPPLDSAA